GERGHFGPIAAVVVTITAKPISARRQRDRRRPRHALAKPGADRTSVPLEDFALIEWYSQTPLDPVGEHIIRHPPGDADRLIRRNEIRRRRSDGDLRWSGIADRDPDALVQ